MVQGSVMEKTRPLQRRDSWASSYRMRELPGWLVKRVVVPEQGLAVLEDRRGRLKELGSGNQAVGGVWRELGSPFRAATARVGVIQARHLHLNSWSTNLLSHDSVLLEADWLLEAQVADASAVYRRIVQPLHVATYGSLNTLISGLVDSHLRALARQYLAEDLKTDSQVLQDLTREIASFLRSTLAGLGLELLKVEHLTFRAMEDEVERVRKLRNLQERLRDEEIGAQMRAMRSEEQMRKFIAKLEHEAELERVFREDEMNALLKDVHPPAEPPAEQEEATQAETSIPEEQSKPCQAETSLPETAAQMVADKAAESEARAKGGMARLATKLEAPPIVAPAGTDAMLFPPLTSFNTNALLDNPLGRFGLVLRYLGVTLIVAAIISFVIWPSITANELKIRVFELVITVGFGLATSKGASLADDAVYRRESIRQADKIAGRLTPDERARAQRLLQANVASQLKRTIDQLHTSRDLLFRSGERDLASELKDLENTLHQNLAQAEALTFVEPEEKASLDQPSQWAPVVDVEEKLMVFAGALASDSDRTYSLAQSRQIVEIRALMPQMISATNQVKNLFTDRIRLLRSF